MLRLYNYLTRKKESFRPLHKKAVGLYTCGPTVYHFVHIGNLRTYIFEDVLRRTLESAGFRVTHVQNLTDVDDKTIRDSQQAGESLSAFTERYARAFFEDIKKLGILPATKYPRATKEIPAMIQLIRRLLSKGLAYRAPDGIYFSIAKFKSYGKLSKIKRRTLKAGARVSADEYSKNDAHDFALWKFKKPGEPSWRAPFGEGRPGWHIECSAMSMRYLGETFDIHAGGIDLLFPHHENEIAQSEGATGKPFVRYFVEGEHLMVDGKKMSKSLGNTYTLRDLEARGYDSLDFRYFVLGAHYRTPLNFTWRALNAARVARLKLLDAIDWLLSHRGNAPLREETELLKVVAYLEKQFSDALEDDLNTPRALAALTELFHYANAIRQRSFLSTRGAKVLLATAREFDRVFGLQLFRQQREAVPAVVKRLIAEREAHRKAKRFAEADRVRNEIKKYGFTVEDTPSGPRLKRSARETGHSIGRFPVNK